MSQPILKKTILKILIFQFLFPLFIYSNPILNFTNSNYTIAENSYLDICISVDNFDFDRDGGIYVYIEKFSTGGVHFPTLTKKLLYLKSSKNWYSFKVGKDNNNINQRYKIKFSHFIEGDDVIFGPESQIEIEVIDIKRTSLLPSRGLFFSGIAHSEIQNNKTAFYLSNSVDIEPGTSFSIVSGSYLNIGQGAGNWYGNGTTPFSQINFVWVGEPSLQEGTNFCIFISDYDPFNLGGGNVQISVNGIDQTNNFLINTFGTMKGFEIDFNQKNTFYLTQGSFDKKSGFYNLNGTVLDGIGLGYSKNELISQGIPQSLAGSISTLDNHSDFSGSFYGILVCDGLIYICDISEYIANPENWEVFVDDKGNIDLQALCDALCGYINCDGNISIKINDCVLSLDSEIPCNEPLTFSWQKLTSSGEWVIVSQGDIISGIVPDYPVSDNGYYQLVIECNTNCKFTSDPILVSYCEDCTASVKITNPLNDCNLFAEVTNCMGQPIYQWFIFENNIWLPLQGANNEEYRTSKPGSYKVIVSGCENCDELSDIFEYTGKATIYKSEISITTKTFRICITWDLLLNMTINGQSMNESSLFHFPYIYWDGTGSGDPDIADLVDDINTWLQANGYLGEAKLLGGKFWCILIECTDREFQNMIYNLGGNTIVSHWEWIAQCDETIPILVATAPCTPTSYLWNTGSTLNYTYLVPGINFYTVTITCENGCIYTGSYGMMYQPIIQQNNTNNNLPGYLNHSFDSKIEMYAYPVPTDDLINISVVVPKTGKYDFKITDILGKVLQNLSLDLSIGINEIHDIELDYPAGIYFLSLSQGNEHASRKIILNK